MKHTIIRVLSVSGIFVIILFAFSGCTNKTDNKLQAEIDTIALKFAPDKRLDLFEIKINHAPGSGYILTGTTTDSAAREAIIKTLSNYHIDLKDNILLLPDTSIGDACYGLVTISVTNLKKDPDHASELVSQAILGTPVIILKKSGSWVLVRTPDRYLAWAESSSIAAFNKKEIEAWRVSDRVVYLDNTGWIYAAPGDQKVISDIVGGSIMQSGGDANGYTSVILPDGRKGFVETGKLMDFNSWSNGSVCNSGNICAVAASLLGIPYMWGGSSAKAADCSGFVQRVFFMNRLILQRDASLQALHGMPVDIQKGYESLEAGDLLFFGSVRNKKPRVTHVAIYLGGRDYINASGMVTVNSLDSTKSNFNKARTIGLLMAKRVLGVEGDDGIVPVGRHNWYKNPE
jgi:gamma-D-glutamyl-L-lysine dipeptidyl-peptidase